MANPGGGNRFVSVNLNKSYGQSSHPNQSNSGSYGSGRGRSGGGGGSGGSGMVVLSRPRSSHKVGPKLSVPPPLNLPSMRKEHERFDSLGSSSGSVGGVLAGSGARPSSSGMGWSKPSAVLSTERDGVGGGDRPLSSDSVGRPGLQGSDGVSGVAAAYMPPSARSGSSGTVVSARVPMEKATVLRGEDFPSLRATLTAVNGPVQKHKDQTYQKEKQGMSEDVPGAQRDGSGLSSLSHSDVRQQLQSSQHNDGHGIYGNGSDRHNSANSYLLDHGRKQDDFFPGPLPLVRLNPRSDWADDERDTSHGLAERGRDHGYSRPDAYWDMDFDWPRSSFLPHKLAQNSFDKRGQRDNDVGKGLSNEVSIADPFSRDVRALNKEGHEGHSWRTPVFKDGYALQEVNGRNIIGSRPTNVNRDTAMENKYIPPQSGANIHDKHNGGLTAGRDFSSGRRDPGHVQFGRQQWNNSPDSTNSRGTERDRYYSESNRYKVESVPNRVGFRPSFSTGSKGHAGNDHLLNFGRDKQSFSRGEKPSIGEPFLKDWGSTGFDGQDPFSSGILGVVKKRKDANIPRDFHDPVRESFEAELERVQKIQEQERQRVIEEQERAMEVARREEEERQRLAREQEECQRRLEEEAREAAWRVEQEKIEALRRAEELRIAREEEKGRILVEEERRKHAAKQKLLELEERIARRQAESAKTDNVAAIHGDILPGGVKERDHSRADDFSSWEDGEKMVERITNTASSDSSCRPFDMESRPVREGSISFPGRGKPFTWRRDIFENGNSSSFFTSDHGNGRQSPRQDASVGGRAFPRKDSYGGAGYMQPRGYYQGGIPEPHMDDLPHARGHRWNISGDGDPYGRNTELEAEFHETVAAKFDVGWGQGRGRGNSTFPDRFYQNSELDELYTYGRSRYPARQPRVLPPPSLSSVHRASFGNEREHSDSAAYEDGSIQFSHTLQSEPSALSYQEAHEEKSDALDVREPGAKNAEQELKRSTTPGCDSQSSLCVSSPPSSPTHLSHDDLDESRDSLAVSGTAEGQDISHSENEVLLNGKAGKDGMLTTASSISVDDDEEWTVENNEELQEQEEYDEDVGYHEEDEAHEVDDENVELTQEFQDLHLGEKDSCTTDNMVLGFDQGVEVGMPNDEFEPSGNIDESLYAGPQATVGIVEQKESFEGSRDEQVLRGADVSQHVTTDSLSVTVQDAEKAVQGFVSDSVHTSHTSTPLDPINAGNFPSAIVLPALQAIPTPVGVNSQSSSQAVVASGPGTQGTAELPVKLQFGLFSGPPLIPSPVPSIQIGSIQMPLQLHPQIGPSLTHMHAPQPPLFQFGQLRYPSPISQGILPLGTPSMSFVQPNVPSSYPSNQRLGGPLSSQPVQDASSQSSAKDDTTPPATNNHHLQLPNQLNVSLGAEKEANVMAGRGLGSNALLHQSQTVASSAPVDQVRPDSDQQVETLGHPRNVVTSATSLFNRAAESRTQGGPSSSHSASSTRYSSVPALQGQLPRNKQRKFAFTARNLGTKLSSHTNDGNRSDANGFLRRPRRVTQRFEFRVRQATDGKQSSSLVSPNNTVSDAKSDSDGKGSGKQPKSGLKKEISSKPKRTLDLEVSSSDQFVSKKTGSGIGEDRPTGKEASTTGGDTTRRAEGSLKRNISSEDVDAPLQSGIVRVFEQPGIEAPSDDDDFIEVRSKRQMLNDRREQREKEIKAKSGNMRKSQRKSQPTQVITSVQNMTKTSVSSSAQAAKSIHTVVMPNRGSINNEMPAFNNVVSQTLAAISTRPLHADSQADGNPQTIKSPQTSSYSTCGQTVESDLTFDAQSTVLDGVHSSAGSWDNSRINQPVMALTQTQLEEAMKPVQFDKQMVSVGHRANSVSEPGLPSSSVLANDSRFTLASSPISSLLAGEKIQFGAVTSPTILPPSTHVSHGIKPPSSQLNIKTSQSMPASENESALLFEKERANELCALEDCEAEAEAAASAVAVAAIGNDEVVGNGIVGCSASISDSKGFSDADVDGMTAGLQSEQQSASPPKVEEGLSVTLPADLSIETPPVSLWPPLPSPHSSSGQMLSPFPGGPTSHFPFYDMNSMMGGPVFAFGTHEESAGAHSQPQKSVVPNSPPLGTWQHCHTGVDSFYRPPAGFTTPFISPPGSIQGVQGPPHMVVYNHFAPVGPFGQVGLSYMGATYIPSGKQPDWKHNTTPSDMGGGGDREINNLNMVSVQRNASNMPAQVQHLAPGSPLLSMASPLAMFDVSSFQNSTDPSAHPHWSKVQASPVSLIPHSMPMQQQDEGTGSSQSNPSVNHHPLAVNAFTKVHSSSSNNGRPFAAASTNAAVAQFPDELRLVESAAPTGHEASGVNKSWTGSTIIDSMPPEGSGSKKNNPRAGVSASHNHKAQLSAQQNSSGQQQYNNYHQRGAAQRNGSGAEWSNRKMGFHGRNHSSGGERGFPPTKVKQIYVAKQTSSGSSSAA